MEGIIVDTSSILFALSNKVDIFASIEEQLGLRPVVSKGVMRELNGIAISTKANSAAAKAAVELISKRKIHIDGNSDYVDDWVIANAKSSGSACTNDTRLRKQLRAMKIKVYTISRSGELR